MSNRFRKSLGKQFGNVRSRFALGGAFTPGDIAGLEADWDMHHPGITVEEDQTGGHPGDGGAIGYLPDASGTLNYLDQSSSSKRPQWNATDSQFNNRPTATFATDDSLTRESGDQAPLVNSLFNTNDGPWSLVIVMRNTAGASPAATEVFFAVNEAGVSDDYVYCAFISAKSYQIQKKANASASNRTSAADTVLAAAHILMLSYTGTVIEARLNGGSTIIDTALDKDEVTNSNTLSMGSLFIGAEGNFLEGTIARSLVYDSDIAVHSKIDQLMDYLGFLYGITVTAVA